MTDHEACEDAELLAATPEDVEAFGVFYRRHVRSVLGAVARRVGDPELAADITAEAFASALVGCARYDPSLGSPSAWLFGIVAHTLSASARRGAAERRARRRLGMDPVPVELDDRRWIEGLVRADTGREAMRYLEELPAPERELLRDRVIEQRSYLELAEERRVSEVAVRKRVSRGLAQIRARFDRAEEHR